MSVPAASDVVDGNVLESDGRLVASVEGDPFVGEGVTIDAVVDDLGGFLVAGVGDGCADVESGSSIEFGVDRIEITDREFARWFAIRVVVITVITTETAGDSRQSAHADSL